MSKIFNLPIRFSLLFLPALVVTLSSLTFLISAPLPEDTHSAKIPIPDKRHMVDSIAENPSDIFTGQTLTYEPGLRPDLAIPNWAPEQNVPLPPEGERIVEILPQLKTIQPENLIAEREQEDSPETDPALTSVPQEAPPATPTPQIVDNNGSNDIQINEDNRQGKQDNDDDDRDDNSGKGGNSGHGSGDDDQGGNGGNSGHGGGNDDDHQDDD